MDIPENDYVKQMVLKEQQMDAGQLFYVVLDGNRLLVDDDTVKEFCLKHGQTITPVIALAIDQFRVANLEALIESNKIIGKIFPPPHGAKLSPL